MFNGTERVFRAAWPHPLIRLSQVTKLPLGALLYVGAVTASGAAIFVAAAVEAGTNAGRFFLVGPINSSYSWIGIGVFLLLAPFASMAVILIPEEGGERSRQSLSAAVVLASVVVFPSYMAVMIIAVSTLVEQLGQRAAYGRRPLYRILFNVAEIALSTGASAAVFQALDGRSYLLHPSLPQHAVNVLLAVLGAVAVAYVTSYGLTIGAVSLSSGVPVKKLFAKSHRSTILPEATAAVMGVLFAYLWLTYAPLSPIALMPLAVIYLAFKNFVRLQEVDRLKSNFISEVSHELRTPLSAILASSELLFHHSGELPVESIGDLSRSTYESSNHLFRLVENLLNATTLQSGTLHIHSVPVSVDELMSEALIQVEPFLESKHQRIELDVPEELPEVLGDARHLVQVLINLLTNASKYSGADTLIRVCAKSIDDEVRVSVLDEGIGIPGAEQEQIFERFYRSESNRVTSVVGSGLGLTIVKSVIHLHGGDVGVNSAPGAGSEFWFTLPKVSPLNDE